MENWPFRSSSLTLRIKILTESVLRVCLLRYEVDQGNNARYACWSSGDVFPEDEVGLALNPKASRKENTYRESQFMRSVSTRKTYHQCRLLGPRRVMNAKTDNLYVRASRFEGNHQKSIPSAKEKKAEKSPAKAIRESVCIALYTF
jgi:hypothetical protein